MEKLTSFLGQNAAYETLVQFTKPWTLYIVSVLRYRGSKMKNTQKSRYHKKNLLEKAPEAKLFRKYFFGENIAEDSAELLAKTWCLYIFWVLRNLPHKFENLADVTKSAKKNVIIWSPRKARAPKNGGPFGDIRKF